MQVPCHNRVFSGFPGPKRHVKNRYGMRGLAAIGLLLVATAAEAYVGPGLGLGVLGAILGGLAAVLLAILGVVWYPLKRLLRKRKRVEQAAEQGQGTEAGDAERQGARKKEA